MQCVTVCIVNTVRMCVLCVCVCVDLCMSIIMRKSVFVYACIDVYVYVC